MYRTTLRHTIRYEFLSSDFYVEKKVEEYGILKISKDASDIYDFCNATELIYHVIV